MPNAIELCKSKRFLPLFITQFLGAFNDNAFKNAFLIWFTYKAASSQHLNAPMMVTLASAIFILPFFMFSATAGQIADKYEKSWLTTQIKFAEIILMLSCALCFYFENITGLLITLFFMGTQSTFFGPIKYSLLPIHLHSNELIMGNGLIEGGTFLSILLGTIFGGLMIQTTHGTMLLSSCVILMAMAGWFASLKIPKSPISDPTLTLNWNIIQETQTIITFAKKEPSVWLSIIGISWFWLVGATFLTQFTTYTTQVIHGNAQLVTGLLTLFSLGIGIGSLICNTLLHGKINGRLVPVGTIGMSLSIALIILFSYIYQQHHLTQTIPISLSTFLQNGMPSWGIILGFLSLSMFGGIYIVPLYAIMQDRSDGQYLSRIIAANNILNAFFMVLSSIITITIYACGFHVLSLFIMIGVLNLLTWFITKTLVNRRKQYA